MWSVVGNRQLKSRSLSDIGNSPDSCSWTVEHIQAQRQGRQKHGTRPFLTFWNGHYNDGRPYFCRNFRKRKNDIWLLEIQYKERNTWKSFLPSWTNVWLISLTNVIFTFLPFSSPFWSDRLRTCFFQNDKMLTRRYRSKIHFPLKKWQPYSNKL